MSNDPVRYGILGTGLIADWLATGFSNSFRPVASAACG